MAPKKKEAPKETSSVKDKQMPDYELVFIVSPEIVDEALETTIDTVSRFITSKGGIVSNVDQWGKRRLAYPIKHFLEGSYVLTQFKMNPAWGKELERSLQISEEVLRHLLIKIE
ncbi:30S ribosomal protein S6 [Chloroflexota bacterium]